MARRKSPRIGGLIQNYRLPSYRFGLKIALNAKTYFFYIFVRIVKHLPLALLPPYMKINYVVWK